MSWRNIARWALIVLIALNVIVWLMVCMLSVVYGEEETGVSYYVLCTPGSEVNIRSKPSTDGDGEGWVTCGDEVEVTAKKNRWARCINLQRESSIGWIHQGYLVDSPVTIHEEPVNMIVKSNGRVAARRSIDGNRRKWLKSGDEMMVYAAGGNWSCTDQGFIKTEFLEEADDLVRH